MSSRHRIEMQSIRQAYLRRAAIVGHAAFGSVALSLFGLAGAFLMPICALSAFAAQPAAGVPKVADIPLPKDAQSVEYSKITGMIDVTSPSDVATLAAFYADTLTGQGWAKEPPTVITDDAAIMKLSKGDANLTIFINRSDAVSEIKLISEGFAWDVVPASKTAPKTNAPPKAKAAPKRATPSAPRGTAKSDPRPTTPPPSVPATPPVPRMAYNRVTVAEQKQPGVTIWTKNQPHKLEYGVAYETKEDDKPETNVLLAEKPIPADQVAALLAKGEDADDVLGFQRHMKLRFTADGKLAYLFMYSDGLSINSGYPDPEEMQAEIAIKDGRARGKVALLKPGKLFDEEYRFEAVFDAKLITGGGAASDATAVVPDPTADGLLADEQEGLPFPLNRTSLSSQGSRYRKSIDVAVPAPTQSVVAFYRRELTTRGWKENPAAANIAAEQAQLAFSGPEGSLTLRVSKQDSDAAVQIAVRYPEKAKAAGILPQPGRGRLVLGNASEREAVIVINGSQYKVAAGRGTRDPKDGTSLHVMPGRYNITIKTPGQADETEELNIRVDETWGVIVLPMGGHLADQLY